MNTTGYRLNAGAPLTTTKARLSAPWVTTYNSLASLDMGFNETLKNTEDGK